MHYSHFTGDFRSENLKSETLKEIRRIKKNYYCYRTMELQALILSVLLLTIVSGVQPKAVVSQCSNECTERAHLGYSDRYDYIYSYEADIINSFHTSAAGDQRAELSLSARARIRVRSKCEMELMFDDVTIQNQERNSALEWERAIRRNTLQFNWQDGEILNICSQEDEPWVLNFKRGFLSALQTSSFKNESAIKEIDVSGECDAAYSVVPNGNEMTITKRKDYSKCVDRDKHMLFSYFTPFTSESPRQNFIFSEQRCENTIKDGIINQVNCDEAHVLRPFSDDENGARTTIKQRIYFKHQQSSPFDRASNTGLFSMSLKFEESSPVVSPDLYMTEARKLMNKICETYESEHYDQITNHFTTLVKELSRLSTYDIQSLYDLTSSTPCDGNDRVLREMIIDAIPFCYSESCVMFGVNLINQNEVSAATAKRWLKGFSFSKSATPGMISSIQTIVSSETIDKDVRQQAYMTTGTMIHRLCSEIGDYECTKMSSVKNAMNSFYTILGNNCRTPNAEALQNIVMSLRAIGNAGVGSYSPVVDMCIEEDDNEMEVRIAAVQTYRRKPCSADRSILESIYFNEKQDSELRIAAYMSRMQCIHEKFIKNTVRVLETEKSQQVASFVSSHLMQMQTTKDPLKYYIKPLLEGLDIKKYELDPTKFSKFREASIFSESLNAGATIDSNVIWSPKSFVPRSAMVNLTLDVFGQAVNLFEIGGRIEGIEGMLQKYLEPKVAEKKLDRERTIDNDITEIDRQYKEKVTRERNARGSGYVRIFGNELAYMQTDFMAHETMQTGRRWIDEFAAQFISNKGYNYHDDSILLNSVHHIPTGVGFPLTVAFNGSTSVDMTAKGAFSLPRGAGFDIMGRFNPRAAVVVKSAMTIDAHITQTGIATETVAMTSTKIKASLSVDRDQHIEFSIDTPYNKNTILEFSHTLLSINNGQVREMATDSVRNARERTDNACTREIAGQKLCYYTSYMNERSYRNAPASPLFPMDGKFEMAFDVIKTDSSLTHYLMTVDSELNYEGAKYIPNGAVFKLMMNTPGSTVNRLTNAHISYSIANKRFAAEVERFGVQHFAQGYIRNMDDGKELVLRVQSGEDMAYEMSTKYKKTVNGFKRSWTLDTVLATPQKTIEQTGELTFEPGKQATFNFEIDNLMSNPIQVKFDLQDQTVNENKIVYSGEGILKIQPLVNTGFELGMKLKPKANNLFLDLTYSFGESRKHSILLNHKRRDRGTSSTTDWSISHDFKSTQFPFLNHVVNVAQAINPKQLQTDVEISYGQEYEQENNNFKLLMSQNLQDLSTNAEAKYSANWKLRVPYTSVDQEVSFAFASSAKVLNATVSLNPHSIAPKILQILLKDKSTDGQLMNKHFLLSIPTPWGNLMFDNAVMESPANIYTLQSSTKLGESVSLSGETTLQLFDNLFGLQTTIRNSDGLVILTGQSENRYSTSPLTASTTNNINVADISLRYDLRVEELQNGYEAESIFKDGHQNKYRASINTHNDVKGRMNTIILEFVDNIGMTTTVNGELGVNQSPDSTYSAYTKVTRNEEVAVYANYDIIGTGITDGSFKSSLSLPFHNINFGISGLIDATDDYIHNGKLDYNGKSIQYFVTVSEDKRSWDIQMKQNIVPENNNLKTHFSILDSKSIVLSYSELNPDDTEISTTTVTARLLESSITLSGMCSESSRRPIKCLDGNVSWGVIGNKGKGISLDISRNPDTQHLRFEAIFDDRLGENNDMYYALHQSTSIFYPEQELEYERVNFAEFTKSGSSVSMKYVSNNRGVYGTGTVRNNRLDMAVTQNRTDLIALNVPRSANAEFSLSDNYYGKQSMIVYTPTGKLSLIGNHVYERNSVSSNIEFVNTYRELNQIPNKIDVVVSGSGPWPYKSELRVGVNKGRQSEFILTNVDVSDNSISLELGHNMQKLRAVPSSITAECNFGNTKATGSIAVNGRRASLTLNKGSERLMGTFENDNVIGQLPSRIQSDITFSKNDESFQVNSLTTVDHTKNYRIYLYKECKKANPMNFTIQADMELDGMSIHGRTSFSKSDDKATFALSHSQNIINKIPRASDMFVAVLYGEEKGIQVSYSLNGGTPRTIDVRHSNTDNTLFGTVHFKHRNPDITFVPGNFKLKMVTENVDSDKIFRTIVSTPRQNDKIFEFRLNGPVFHPTSGYLSFSFSHNFETLLENDLPQRASFSTIYRNNDQEANVEVNTSFDENIFELEFTVDKESKSGDFKINHNGQERLYTGKISSNLEDNNAEFDLKFNLDGFAYGFFLAGTKSRKLRTSGYQIFGKTSFKSVFRFGDYHASYNITGDFNSRYWMIVNDYKENISPMNLEGRKTVKLEKKGQFNYVSSFNDVNEVSIFFERPTESTFRLVLNVTHDIDDIAAYIPKRMNEVLEKLDFDDHDYIEYTRANGNFVKLAYDFTSPSTKSMLKLSHNFNELNAYNIPTTTGYNFSYTLVSKQSRGEASVFYNENTYTVNWNMPRANEILITLISTDGTNAPNTAIISTKFMDSSVRVRVNVNEVKSASLVLTKISEQAFELAIDQTNMLENIPRSLTITGSYSPSSVELVMKFAEDVVGELSASYNSGRNSASIQVIQHLSTKAPENTQLKALLDIAEMNAQLEAIWDEKRTKVSISIDPERISVSLQQNCCEMLPQSTEAYLSYSSPQPKNHHFECSVTIDSKTYKATLDSNGSDNGCQCDFNLMWDQLGCSHSAKIVWDAQTLSISGKMKQNMFDSMPANAEMSEIYLWSATEKSYTFHLAYEGGEPIDFTIKWQPKEGTVFGDISLTHKIQDLEWMPKQASMNFEKYKKGRIAVHGSVDNEDFDVVGEISDASISFTHNFNLLSQLLNVPNRIILNVDVQLDQGTIEFRYGDYETSFEYSYEMGSRARISFSQNIYPRSRVVIFLVEKQETTDESNSVMFTFVQDSNIWKVTPVVLIRETNYQATVTVMYGELSAELNLAFVNSDTKSVTIIFNQHFTPFVRPSLYFTANAMVNEERAQIGGAYGGDRSSAYTIEVLVAMPTENSAEMTITHNIPDIPIGQESAFTITWVNSKANPSLELRAVMDGEIQKINFSGTVRANAEYSLEMSNNIQTAEFEIPTSAAVKLTMVRPNSAAFTIGYTYDGKERLLNIEMGQDDNTAMLSFDQNIAKKVNILGSKFVIPKKSNLQYTLQDDGFTKISAFVKAKGRQTANLFYKIDCNAITQEIEIRFNQDMENILPGFIPRDASFRFMRNSEQPLTIALTHDEVSYSFVLNYGSESSVYSMSVLFDHTSPLSNYGVPSHMLHRSLFTDTESKSLSMMNEVNADTYELNINDISVSENSIGMVLSCNIPSKAINTDIRLQIENGNYSVSITGQYLNDQVVSDIATGVSVRYESGFVSTNFFHNIGELDAVAVPRHVYTIHGQQYDAQTKTLTYKTIVKLQDMSYVEETFVVTHNSNYVTIKGTTTSLYKYLFSSLVAKNPLYSYNAKFTWDINDNNFDIQATWTGRVDDNIVNNDQAGINGNFAMESSHIGISCNVQRFNAFGVPRRVVLEYTHRKGTCRNSLTITTASGEEEALTVDFDYRKWKINAQVSNSISWVLTPFRKAVVAATLDLSNGYECAASISADDKIVVSIASTNEYQFEEHPRMLEHTSSITFKDEEVFSAKLSYLEQTEDRVEFSNTIKVIDNRQEISFVQERDNHRESLSAKLLYSLFMGEDDEIISYRFMKTYDYTNLHYIYEERLSTTLDNAYFSIYVCNYEYDFTNKLAKLDYILDDTFVKFRYNVEARNAFSFTHNSDFMFETLKIPKSIVGTYEQTDDDITFNITVNGIKIMSNANIARKSFDTEFYYSGTLVLALSSQISTNPNIVVNCDMRIPPLRNDFNAQVEILPSRSSEKGFKFVLTDRSLRTPRKFEVDVLGQYDADRKHGLISIVSDLEQIDNLINFKLEGSSDPSNTFTFIFSEYSFRATATNRNISIELNTPEHIGFTQGSFNMGSTGLSELDFKSYAQIVWNNDNKIRITANCSQEEESELDISFEHPFDWGFNTIVVQHHGHSTSRVASYHTHVIVDGQDTHIATTYRGTYPNFAGNHNIKVTISHPFDNKYIPSTFITNGKLNVQNGLYDSRWSITGDDNTSIVLNKLYRKTRNGVTMSMQWQQPFDELVVREVDADFKNTDDIPVSFTMNVNHAAENKYIPKQSTNAVSVMMDDTHFKSTWYMRSGDEELISFQNDWSSTAGQTFGNVVFRQPFYEFGLTELDFSIEGTCRDGFHLFTTHTQVNEKDPVDTKLEVTYNVDNSIVTSNTEAKLAIGDREYISTLENIWGGTASTGYKFVYNLDYIQPSETRILSVKMPAKNHFKNQLFWRNKNLHVRSIYQNSEMDEPVGVDAMYMVDGDTIQAAFTGNFSITGAPRDIYYKVTVRNIDMGKDCKLVIDSPLFGTNDLTLKATCKYDGAMTIKIIRGDEDPIVLKAKLGKVISCIKEFMESSAATHIMPSIEWSYGQDDLSNGKDSFIGLIINGVPHNLHILTKIVDETAMIILRSENGDRIKEIARITAAFSDEDSLRITASGNNAVSAFTRAMLHIAGEEVSMKVTLGAENVVTFLQSLRQTLEGNHVVVDLVYSKIDTAIDQVNTIQDKYKKFVNEMNEFTISKVGKAEDQVERSIKFTIAVFQYVRNQLQEVVIAPTKSITRDYYVQAADQFIAKIRSSMTPIKTALDMINAGDLLMELVEEGVMKTMFYIERNVEASLASIEQPIARLVEVTDNTLILEIPMSVQINLEPLPTASEVLMWIAQSSFTNEIDLSVQKLYSLSDDYYRLRSLIYKPLDELIPPYKGHAEITSFKHIRTFDGSMYDFKSSCSSTHVLARDFRDGDFTVYMKYGGVPSIIVKSANGDGSMQYVELRSDYSVLSSSGRQYALPINANGVTVMRKGDFIKLNTDMGLSVTCNFKNELCHIDVSAFYFGSTAGLAGTFNNEIYDDFSQPSDGIATEVEEMAVSWTASDESCRITNTYTSCENRSNDICESLFADKSSALRSCFPVVDILPYIQMCKKDTCRQNDDSSCAAVAAYQRRCELAGAPIAMPNHCVKCETNNGLLMAGASERRQITSADVVFVVQKSSCMNVRRPRMRHLLDALHDTLDSNIGDVRYAVIGFGDLEASSHTFHGDIFKQARQGQNFNSHDILDGILARRDSDDEPDILSAISAATQLPFHAGASRTIILFTCDECSSDSQINSAAVTEQLLKQGIVLHHFRSSKILSGKGRRVYGFSNDDVYSFVNVARDTVKTSKDDACLDIVSSTNGSVWNTNMFRKKSVTDLMQMISNEITNKAQSASSQICECVPGPNGPVSVCTA